MVGSSWKSPDSSGLAPTMSPPAAVMEYGWPLRAVRSEEARYSTPPAGIVFVVPSACVSVTLPAEPAGGSRLPCRSLKDSSWTSTVRRGRVVPVTAVLGAGRHRGDECADGGQPGRGGEHPP